MEDDNMKEKKIERLYKLLERIAELERVNNELREKLQESQNPAQYF